MHGAHVGFGNAEEVWVQSDKSNSLTEEGEEESLFIAFGVDIVFWFSHSLVEAISLVNPDEVDEIPGNHQNESHDDLDAGADEQLSCSLVVFSEEANKEGCTKDQWDIEQEYNKCKPPVNIVVQE